MQNNVIYNNILSPEAYISKKISVMESCLSEASILEVVKGDISVMFLDRIQIRQSLCLTGGLIPSLNL